MYAEGMRYAGPREENIPDFGTSQIVQEIDSAEKIAREVDRQLRYGSTLNVVRRTAADGSVRYEAGAEVLSQAAVGDDLLGYTEIVSGRNSIRTGSRIYNRTNDATPLTHTHTRLVNVAVVERRNRDPGDGTDSATFEVQEATVVPKKAGMSILMFDLCCSKGRRTRPKKPRARSGMREDPSPEQVGAAWEAPSRVKVWDPTIDYHLSSVQRARQSSSDVQ
ncbi:hypothetical protein GUITHDRAFT_161093, partial [Guillardia theta CCMP2712]